MSSKPLQYALRYAEKGLRVFPVARKGKGPCHNEIDSWKKAATTEREIIKTWFNQPNPPNVGLATGAWEGSRGVFVVDIDVGEINGYETWKALQSEKAVPVPETYAVETPSGGAHLYFKAPPGAAIKSATDTLGDAVDTKGHGGYVVAPPSTTEEGAYTFREAGTSEIAEAPFWLVNETRKRSSKEKRNASRERSPASLSYTDDPDAEIIEDALQAIPPQPGYEKWFRIIAAVKDAVDSDQQAARLLEQWSPENRHGDYTYEERLRNAPDQRITAGTLFHYAKLAGWSPPWEQSGKTSPRGDGQVGKPPHPAELRQDSTDGEEPEVSLDDLSVQTAPEIIEEDLQPLRPLVTYEDRIVLPEGTSLLAAKPKIGKTLLSMNTAVGIATGGKALGSGSVRQGCVLYLNLDGSKRGTQSRLKTMFRQEPSGPPKKLHLLHGEYPVVGEGGLALLDQWCKRHPDTELIIVDTLQHLRPSSDGRRNVYEEDYEFVYPIAKLGRKHDTSILLVHHLNKLQRGDELDKVSGSTALTGAVENVLLLDRERGDREATLKVRPREAPDEEFHVEFDETLLTWTLGGIPTPGTTERKEIWKVVRSADGPIQLEEIAGKVDKAKSTVSEHLGNLKTEDNMPLERPQQGFYQAA